jgi:hypothetical protein
MSKDDLKKNAEKVEAVLNNALSNALKNYKKKHGELPECGYHFCLKKGMTLEEELLEIFHALVRSGKSPEEAKDLAPTELGKIYEKMELFEKYESEPDNA